VSAPGSRFARQMRPHLDTELWDEFVEHANRHYKVGRLRAFAPKSAVLRCVGTLDGATTAPCTHAVLIDLIVGAGTGVGREREVGKALEQLHLGHELPLPRRATAGARQYQRRRGHGTTGWTVQRCATTCLGCALASRTAPRVCGFDAALQAMACHVDVCWSPESIVLKCDTRTRYKILRSNCGSCEQPARRGVEE